MGEEAGKKLPQQENVERQPIVIGVTVDRQEWGIPLHGWESVAGALNVFASGQPPSSRATETHQMKAVAQSGGALEAGFYSVMAHHIVGNPVSFVSRMLDRAKPVVQENGAWERSYDYDGVGSFFKTNVEIERIGSTEDYILHLYAAYVGDKVEVGLAETLGVERGLLYQCATVEYEPEDDQFRIDFGQVAERLKPVAANLQTEYKPEELTGEIVADQLMKIEEYDRTKPFVLGTKDGIEITVGLGRVGRRFDYGRSTKLASSRWEQQGSVILGPLDTDYSDRTKFASPTLSINIRPVSEKEYHRLPAVDPEKKALIEDLTNQVVSAFK